tara:strand:+ start:14756 stop:15409 length:654 start_codon:yes stop_codon:yes gene_type:complete
MENVLNYLKLWRNPQNYDKLIIIFPGFGLYPHDYEDILPNDIPKIYMDIWTEDELDFIKHNVGKPGSDSYNDWYKEKITTTEHELANKLENIDYENIKSVIFFSHSLGSEIAHSVCHYSDIMITYGGIINRYETPVLNLIGSDDKILHSKQDVKWSDNCVKIEGGTHFSCVKLGSESRSIRWRDTLKFPYVEESNTCNKPIKRKILELIKNFINDNE